MSVNMTGEIGKIGNWTISSEDLLRRNFPLHRACRDGDLEALTSLLSTGECDVYAEDDFYGWTPIHWAAYFGKLACLRLLVNQLACAGSSASCDLANTRFRQTPVHLCSLGGHPQCLLWLLQSGARLEAQDYLGETPVHKAARSGSMECISLLVSHGSKLCIRNHSGNTANQIAASSGFPECAKYLENAMLIQNQTNGVCHETQAPVTCVPSNGVNVPSAIRDPNKKIQRLGTIPYDLNELNSIDGALLPKTNGTACHSSSLLENGLIHDNNNQSDDCDMETGEEAQDGDKTHLCGAHNGDAFLADGDASSLAHWAGKKRSREEMEHCLAKRPRNDVNEQHWAGTEETAHNNTILSSYFAILAISTAPLKHGDGSDV